MVEGAVCERRSRPSARARPRALIPLIIIADDDGDMRSLIATSLRRAGMDVLEVANGDELLVRLADLRRSRARPLPDLVLSDIHMPGVNGLDVLVRVKAITPALPVVMMTASGNGATRASALGATAVLGKPLDLGTLASTLKAILRR